MAVVPLAELMEETFPFSNRIGKDFIKSPKYPLINARS